MKKHIMSKVVLFMLVAVIALYGTGCNSDKGGNIGESAVDTGVTEMDDSAVTEVETGAEGTDAEAKEAEEAGTQEAEAEDAEAEDAEAAADVLPIDFELLDSRGEMVNLKELGSGKLTFVNFFTTWCTYCMQEMPEFQEVYEAHADKIQIIIVDVNHDSGEKSVDEVVKWYEESGYTFPMVIDEDASKTSEFLQYVQGYPTTFVYDGEGKFLGYIPGAMDKAMMLKIIEAQGK